MSHFYYYDIQTHIHVTKLPWCDCCLMLFDHLWTIHFYNVVIVTVNLWKRLYQKLSTVFYFNIYFPSIVSCVVISSKTDLFSGRFRGFHCFSWKPPFQKWSIFSYTFMYYLKIAVKNILTQSTKSPSNHKMLTI